MNNYMNLAPKFRNFKSPLNLIPNFKSLDHPSDGAITDRDLDDIEISKERALSENVTDDEMSSASQEEYTRPREPAPAKPLQRFSRFKFEKMFSRKSKALDDCPDFFKSKLKQARCLSSSFSSERGTPKAKSMNIQGSIKKINVFLQNKILHQKYLTLPKGLRKKTQKKRESVDLEDLEEAKVNGQEEAIGKIENEINSCTSPLDVVTNFIEKSEEISPNISLDVSRGQTEDTGMIQPASTEGVPETIDTGVVNNTAAQDAGNSELAQANEVGSGNNPSVPAVGVVNQDNVNGESNIRTENVIINNTQEEAMQAQMNNLDVIIEREASFRLRRAFITFLSIFFGSMSLSLMYENGFSHHTFFFTLYAFLIYYFAEGWNRVFSTETVEWKKVENLFNTIDIASVFFFLVIVHLKFSNMISSTTFAPLLPLSSAVLYFFYSKAPRSVLESQTITRVLFTLQIFLLTAKIDGHVTWAWKGIVCLVWIYLGMMVLYFVLLAFMMALMLALAVFNINLYQNMDKKTQIIGFFWYLFYTGLSPLLFATLIGVCDAYDHRHDFKLLYDCVFIARYVAIVAMLFTRLTYPILITFLKKFNIDEPEFRVQVRAPESGTMTKMEIEKRDIYLVMLSSTYFLPLKQTFLLKSKENLRRCKRALDGSKMRLLKRGYPKWRDLNKYKPQFEAPISIEALRKAKDELAKKFTVTMKRRNQRKSGDGNTKTQKKGMARERSFNFLNFPLDWKTFNGEEIPNNASLKPEEACFSEGDKEDMTNWSSLDTHDTSHLPTKLGENLCYICFDRVSNAVMMKCGHGGICYECAIQLVKNRNRCMECRRAIENVVKINPNPKVRNIIKGYETTKLIGVPQAE